MHYHSTTPGIASVWWTSKQAAPVWGARLSLWCQGGDGSALTDRSGHEKVIAGLVFLSHLTAQLSSSTKVIYSQKLTTRWKNFKTIPGMTQPWERVRPFKQVFLRLVISKQWAIDLGQQLTICSRERTLLTQILPILVDTGIWVWSFTKGIFSTASALVVITV